MILEILREAKGPLTAGQISEELTQRQIQTTSTNLRALVQNRLSELVKKGILRLAPGRKGVVLKKHAGRPIGSTTEAATQTTEQPHLRNGQPSLRSLLTDLLAKRKKPMAARDLAEKVLATGYKTKSKNFASVVWTTLGSMEGVENVKGKGWLLKKG